MCYPLQHHTPECRRSIILECRTHYSKGTGSGIEKYGTEVQQDHSDQQSAADERSEQIAVYTC